jgi:hypothetical protein
VRRRFLGPLVATAALGLAVPTMATAGSLPGIPLWSQGQDGIRLPAGGRGAVAVVDLPNDAIGAGPEYEALQVMGVPATVVPLGADLSPYRVAILAGAADAASVDDAAGAALAAYVEGGGTLIAEAVTAPALRPLFGIDGVTESQDRASLSLCAGCDPTLAQVTTKTERQIELDDAQGGGGVGTVGYAPAGDAQVLGTFDDGTAALLVRRQDKGGAAFAVGARVLDLVTRHWEGARFSSQRAYVNSPEADADAWLLWLRGVWRTSSPGGVTLSTLPAGVTAQVILTISANWGDGLLNTPTYLRAIRKAAPRASGTVFVPTRTKTDWLDDAFFPTPGVVDYRTAKEARALQAIVVMGAELGSESVSHSAQFATLPIGNGDETWQDYDPFIEDRKTTRDATLFGELLVSRALLRGFQPDVPSFRAPYLLTSRNLSPAEDKVGYRFDSSTTQGATQTAFPFHPPRLDDRGFSDVVSFPITVEDESKGGLEGRLDSTIAVASAAIDNGAPATILLHPRSERDWRDADVKLIDALSSKYGKGLSVDSVATYGTFWLERDQLALMTRPAPAGACGGQGGIALAVANRGGAAADRQALTVGDPSYTRAEFFFGRTRTIAVENGSVELPRINPGRTLVGVLCA